jgi:uncharacterized protein (TIGR03000 family)
MYSIVLMAALTAGESTPELFFHGGCGGWGGGCHGWYGCSGWGGWHGYGRGCYGYWGCYGSCYGSCYGVCYGGYGGWGAPYHGYGPGWAGYDCFGGCGGYASSAYGMPGPLVAPSVGGRVIDGDGKKAKDGKDEEGGEVSTPDRARLIFNLPRDAKLYVDDKPISNVTAKRTFQTPALAKGQEYYYEVRAEVMRDGKPVSETKRVIVKAGAVIRTDFGSLGASTGVASAKK